MIVDLHFEAPAKSGPRQVMGFSQPEFEGALEQAVIDASVELRRGLGPLPRFCFGLCADRAAEMKSLEQTDSEVTLSFQPWPASDEAPPNALLKAKYLVGCDGANSSTRSMVRLRASTLTAPCSSSRQCGFSMTDLNFAEDWLVCDLVRSLSRPSGQVRTRRQILTGGQLPDRIASFPYGSQICDPARPSTVAMAGKGRKRLEFMRLPGETREQLNNPETAWRLIEEWGFTKVRLFASMLLSLS